jgi:predicted MFS family arabinose efflux permease
VLFTGSSIGAMIAAPLATTLEKHFGWRLAFVGVALIGLVWVPVWIATAWTPSGRALVERHLDEGKVERPPVREVITHPAVLRALLVVVAVAPMIGFVLLWGAKYLVATFHVTQTDVGKYFWLPPLFFDLGALLFGDLATRHGRKSDDSPRVIFTVAMIVTAAFASLAPFAKTPWQAMGITAMALAGGGGLFAMLTHDMLARVSPAAISLAGGCTAAAQSLAYVVANPLIGRAVERSGSYRMVFFTLAAWAIPGCVAWLSWPPPPRASL